MGRPVPEMQNYESDVLPLTRLYANYKHAFIEGLIKVPGNFYAVANFNLPGLEPEWCYERLNLFDMKVGRRLHGKHWCRTADAERPTWIAVPERATYLHYNMIWDVPIRLQERFFLDAPDIWRQVVPSGTFHLQVIGEEVGEDVAARIYTGKTFHPRWTIDNTIMSAELRRKK